MEYARRLKKFPEYIFSRLEKEKKALEEKTGKPVLDLGPGSPNFPPKSEYIDKFSDYIHEKDAHLYPGYGPIHQFQDALLMWYKARFDVELSPKAVYPLLGAKEGIAHLALTLLDPQDEAMIPDPGYPAYAGSVLLADGKVVTYDLLASKDYKISMSQLKRRISRRTRYIVLNFPSNPTGATITKEELEEIVEIARKKDVWLVYDNAYSEITFGEYKAPSILQIPKALDVAVEVGSFSKTFSFAGFRIGYIVGNEKLIASLAKVKSQIDSGMSTALQKMAANALQNFDHDWHRRMLRNYEGKRDILVESLLKLDLKFTIPKGGLYIWAQIPEGYEDSEVYAQELLHKKQILVAPGIAFGQNGWNHVRMSICKDLERIHEYF